MNVRKVLRWVVIALGMTVAVSQRAFAQFPSVLMADELDGSNGFLVRATVWNQFARTQSGVGDVNADGVDDLMSGGGGLWWYPDCYCEPTDGMAYVIFGRPDLAGDGLWYTDDLDGTTGFSIPETGFETRHGNVSAAGDFNNDGIRDFMVGAPAASPGGWWQAGECYVIYGGPGVGSEGSFDVSSLDGSNGFTIYGSSPSDHIGGPKAAIGDFNADGVDDIIFGNVSGSPGGHSYAGQCYVIFGGTGIGASGEFHMSDLEAQTGIVINGIGSGDATGSAISAAGDVNGDGFADVLIGSNGEEPPGEAYVVFGGPSVGVDGVLELSSLHGTNGFIIRAPPGHKGGAFVAGLGDVNCDGFDDLATSVWQSVQIYWVDVVFGGSDVAPGGVFELSTLDGSNGFSIVEEFGDYRQVTRPAAAGDLNHDGIADLTVKMARTWVILGAPDLGASGSIVVDDLDGRDGFKIQTTASPRGWASVGDVNDDGIDDFVLGSGYEWDSWTGADLGQLHVIFGRRMGDADLDADVDLGDFAEFQRCFLLLIDDDVPDDCHPFDFDRDNDVDLSDLAEFASALNEP